MWFNSKNNNMKKVKLVQIEVKDLIQLKPAKHILSKYCVNGRIPWPWVLYIIYRLYKDAIHGKQIKANKFPHDSSPIHVNYNLSNIC